MRRIGPAIMALLAIQGYCLAQQQDADQNDSVVVESGAASPITGEQRMTWWAKSTFGPTSLFGGAVTSGIRTGLNHPVEYGTHWEGFADRYGMRLASVSTSNAMEASLGAIWGEDPRYSRAASGTSLSGRLGHVVKWTFVAPNRNGDLHPAYARFVAIGGTSFLSNTWRVESEDSSSSAMERIGTSFLTRVAGNAFKEFMPDAKKKLFHRQ